MRILFRLLLPAATTAVLLLIQPVIAQEPSVKPAKSAQDCADELLRNKEAIEAAGETPQEFFHRCWWDSTPGKPTPIKTPRATWDPGRGRPSRPAAAKPTIDAKQVTEPKKAIDGKKSVETKKAVEAKKTLQTKPAVATKQASETKPARAAKTSTEVGRPDAAAKAAEAATPPKPPAKPASIAEAKPARKDVAAPKPAASMPSTSAKKDVSAVKTPPVTTPLAKGPAVVTAPDAAPASVKPASPGAVVVKSSANSRAKPTGTKTKSARVAARGRRTPVAGHAAAQAISPPEWRPARRVATHREPAFPYYAYRPAPSRFFGRGIGRRAIAQGAVLCLYAAPDARGHSACVPVP